MSTLPLEEIREGMWFISGRFTPLLAILAGVIIVAPLTRGLELPFVRLTFTLLFFISVYALSRSRAVLLVGVVLAIPSILASWTSYFEPRTEVDLVHLVFEAAFLGYTAAIVLARVLQEERVNADTIYGGVSVYILLGLTWSTLYTLTEYLAPGSLVVGGVPLTEVAPDIPLWETPETLYFSFVTITTLGYGDIAPQTEVSQTLAITEAIVGQLFVAIFMARLVGLHVASDD